MSVIEQAPQYTLTCQDDGREEKYQLTVHLPGVESASELDVVVRPNLVSIRVPGRYKLDLLMHPPVLEKPELLRFVKKKSQLKAILVVDVNQPNPAAPNGNILATASAAAAQPTRPGRAAPPTAAAPPPPQIQPPPQPPPGPAAAAARMPASVERKAEALAQPLGPGMPSSLSGSRHVAGGRRGPEMEDLYGFLSSQMAASPSYVPGLKTTCNGPSNSGFGPFGASAHGTSPRGAAAPGAAAGEGMAPGANGSPPVSSFTAANGGAVGGGASVASSAAAAGSSCIGGSAKPHASSSSSTRQVHDSFYQDAISGLASKAARGAKAAAAQAKQQQQQQPAQAGNGRAAATPPSSAPAGGGGAGSGANGSSSTAAAAAANSTRKAAGPAGAAKNHHHQQQQEQKQQEQQQQHPPPQVSQSTAGTQKGGAAAKKGPPPAATGTAAAGGRAANGTGSEDGAAGSSASGASAEELYATATQRANREAAQQWLERALAAARQGDLSRARVLLDRAVGLCPAAEERLTEDYNSRCDPDHRVHRKPGQTAGGGAPAPPSATSASASAGPAEGGKATSTGPGGSAAQAGKRTQAGSSERQEPQEPQQQQQKAGAGAGAASDGGGRPSQPYSFAKPAAERARPEPDAAKPSGGGPGGGGGAAAGRGGSKPAATGRSAAGAGNSSNSSKPEAQQARGKPGAKQQQGGSAQGGGPGAREQGGSAGPGPSRGAQQQGQQPPGPGPSGFKSEPRARPPPGQSRNRSGGGAAAEAGSGVGDGDGDGDGDDGAPTSGKRWDWLLDSAVRWLKDVLEPYTAPDRPYWVQLLATGAFSVLVTSLTLPHVALAMLAGLSVFLYSVVVGKRAAALRLELRCRRSLMLTLGCAAVPGIPLAAVLVALRGPLGVLLKHLLRFLFVPPVWLAVAQTAVLHLLVDLRRRPLAASLAPLPLVCSLGGDLVWRAVAAALYLLAHRAAPGRTRAAVFAGAAVLSWRSLAWYQALPAMLLEFIVWLMLSAAAASETGGGGAAGGGRSRSRSHRGAGSGGAAHDSGDEAGWGRGRAQAEAEELARGGRLEPEVVKGATGEIERVLSARDYFTVLGLPACGPEAEGLTDEAVRGAYRRTQLKVHPDKAGPDAAGAAKASQRVNQAYSLLQTADSRKRLLQQMRAPPATAGRGGGGASSASSGGGGGSGSQFHRGAGGPESVDMECWACGGVHSAKIFTTDRSRARYCNECRTHHAAHENDMWIWEDPDAFLLRERKLLVCLHGVVWDVTGLGRCSRMFHDARGRQLPANTHTVQYRLDNSKSSSRGGPDQFRGKGDKAGSRGRRGKRR